MRIKRFLSAALAVSFCILFPLSAQCAKEGEPTAAPTTDLSQTFSEKAVSSQGDRGERTVRIQRRLKDLGYLSYRPTGYFMSMTNAAVIAFQNNHSIMTDGAGVVGDETMGYLFSSLAKRKNVAPENSNAPETRQYPAEGAILSWDDMDGLLPVDSSFRIIDVYTSIEYTVKRVGGARHMDVLPVDNASYNAYLKSFSGTANTNKRPVLVECGGDLYAASIYGMPHTIDGKEVTCLYFSGSVSDTLGIQDAEHDANVLIAAGIP